MDRIVGRYFFWMALFITSIINADLSLKLFDTNHVPLNQAGAGHPFLIEVSVSDVASIGQTPQIEGLDQFVVKNSGVRITSINGKTTGKFNFEVRIDTPGTYTVGPALLMDRGNELRSNSVRVVVGQEQIEQVQSGSKKKKEAPTLLRLSADKKQVVVGERIGCSLRFYYANPAISLRQFISEQESPELRRSKAYGPFDGTETINGIEYNYIEWRWDLFPTQSGTITIPAYGADYEKQVDRDDLWGGLGRWFGTHAEAKRIYSNAISLQVDPLGVDEKKIDAIGDYSAFVLSAQPALAKQGEGIVVAVELIGDGDAERVRFAGLQKMPSELKHYQSTQSYIPSQDGQPARTRFEFIVQGLKPGSWQIPSQKISYYDTQRRTLKTLESNPLSLQISPAATAPSMPTHNQSEPAAKENAQALAIGGIYKVGQQSGRAAARLPWWLFAFLALLPLFFVLYLFARNLLEKKTRASYRARKAQAAFAVAKKRLDQARAGHNSQSLYGIFIELFADRWQEPIAVITDEYIKERFESVGLSPQLCQAWQEFFATITECAFNASQAKPQDNLFTQARQWIERLEKQL